MKFTKIAVATGLALAAMSVQAAGPTIPAGTKVIFLAGASAPDNFLADISSSMLTGVTAIRSRDAGVNHRAYLGKAAAGIPNVPVGTDILFIKRSAGGSVFGVDPIARAARIQTLDLNSCTEEATTVGSGSSARSYNWSCDLKGIDPGVTDHATASNTGLVADFGVADVEPAMFKQPYNTENGQAQLSSAELGRLTNSPLNQIMMGIVATDAVAATTHISRAQYGAMLAGKIDNWSAIDGSEDAVVVCRRVEGSGTQTSYNWFFSGFPCNSSTGGFADTPPASASNSFGYDGNHAGSVADPIIIDPSAGFTVVENSGSGDVRNCLKAAQNRTLFTVKGANNLNYKVDFSLLSAPAKAIGVLSLDSYTNAVAAGSGFSFRHLDGAGTFNGSTQTSSTGATGIAPSKDNLLNGKYDFVVELSMQKRNTSVTNVNGDLVPALSADAVKNGFYNEFVKRAGATKYTGNDGGTFTSVPNAFASLPQFTSYTAKPTFVSKYSRNGNTCAPLVAFPSL
jgi:hypothetical protein